MPRTEPLPAGLQERPFVLTDPCARGLSRSRLRAGDLASPSRSIRIPAGAVGDERGLAEAVLALTPNAWLSHQTAARLYGLTLPAGLAADPRIHVSRPQRRNPPQRRGVCGHVGRIDLQAEVGDLDGLPITRPSRTWFDLLSTLTLQQAVVIGDQLIRTPRPGLEDREQPWCTIDDLAEVISRNDCRPGIRLGREALPLIRVGSDSPPETLLRLAIVAAGLPEPELQIPLLPGVAGSPEGDLGYRNRKLVMQYEGQHHLHRQQQTSDIRRDQLWQDAGWQVLRCDVADLRQGFVRPLQWVRMRLAA
ncbi:hypothetical protein [Naumannella halotolerans]|uniref:DUF559 domain-containing protein n=1 Tax=Naumannella halotolerans TaxID=993414 RepID=A0A4V3EMM8_9ACTN|nr:hypothetical protein [Naumannella halotolerans]TDT30028.1 hypothetical protein CLV29_3051 [Naumannella halotolerans]